jgi:hypothetical protein
MQPHGTRWSQAATTVSGEQAASPRLLAVELDSTGALEGRHVVEAVEQHPTVLARAGEGVHRSAYADRRQSPSRSGCCAKNSHMTSLAEMENVVDPTTASICFENSLPGHVCPPPSIW